MKTLKNAVDTIFAIADAHPEIAARYFGDNIKVDDSQQMKYPLLHIEPSTSSIEKGIMVINLNVTIADLPPESDFTSLETHNKALQILNDVIGEFALGFTHANVNSREYFLEQPISVTPITPAPEFNDRLVGWSAELSITVENKKTGCKNNIINIDEGAFSSAFSSAFNTI